MGGGWEVPHIYIYIYTQHLHVSRCTYVLTKNPKYIYISHVNVCIRYTIVYIYIYIHIICIYIYRQFRAHASVPWASRLRSGSRADGTLGFSPGRPKAGGQLGRGQR